ncbi:DUF4124 domain-containing protein [Stenotrophomonas sp. MMGLT7]|uniref:DUF4124 domain-containing protein n=1 Tax=Stenotrophomonas sp. MMGLT7 TaxID=2901227 RepID=UPI001E35846B|nr:DUF4124 domain-containing protein [Stenotrophomonas sp. MMGLT7]MCD7100269.1 DUF4124 domain-containing protein [Stenotrophomonas sp. MMGLT7]
MRAVPVLCLLLCASFAAHAAKVYQWKDANGVTHYSERPPAGQEFASRTISNHGNTVPVAAAQKTPESQGCLDARRNLELLSGDVPVMQDTDGDGKPDRTLDEGQRAAQKNLAEAATKAYCQAP